MRIFKSRKPKIHRYLLLATLLIVSVITAPRAKQSAPSSNDRVELYQALLDLQNPWTVMCVAAHPDDEDGTSLIVMRRKFGAHTVSLFSTFGEGGQNAIGPELYEELGAIRARETMAAAEIQGSEPHFLGLKDFGYSKTRDEAFRFWGHEEALRRMVLEIRKLRPDVIITNHSTTSNDHGQHQATALMVVEAFDAAADPSKFPEQLKDGVTTWQVQRLFVRARGNQTQNADAQIVTIDPNERDPVRGVVYAEEALRGLQQHATQGPWPKSFAEYANRFRAFSGQTAAPTGQLPVIRYALVKSANGAAGARAQESHNFLDGLQLPDSMAKTVQPPALDGKPLTDFVDKPERLLQALALSQMTASRSHVSAFANDPRVLLMKDRLYRAMGAASGITVSMAPKENVLVPGDATNFALTVTNRGTLTARLERVEFNGKPIQVTGGVLAPNQNKTVTGAYKAPPDMKVSVPHAQHLYDGREFGESFTAMAYLSTQSGVPFVVPADIRVDVAPPVELEFVTPELVAITPGSVNFHWPFLIQVVNHQSETHTGKLVALRSSDNQKDYGDVLRLTPGAKLQVKLPARNVLTMTPAEASALKSFNLALSWQDDRKGSELIGQRLVPVTYADARIAPKLNVGYIRGFDFSLPNALNALGVESKELSVDEVNTADLSKFTSVIVDNRVYESKPELIAANQKLLDYANAGGNLIVFYHKSDEWNPDPRRNRPQLAPYKLILGGDRVTDENAPITFTEPDHPLLNTPNKMGQDDFKDWIQERELRGAIPGAYRMLANMISYGRN